MKTIHIAGGAFLTGTEIAEALMGYGLELARAGCLDDVEFPFIDSVGTIRSARVRLGWRCDTVLISTDECADELVDAETIFGLIDKTQIVLARRLDQE